MSIATAVIGKLTETLSVYQIVADRIYHKRAFQNSGLPRIVVTTVSDRDGYTLGGSDGLNRARVQVDCYADESEVGATTADDIADAVLDLLTGYSGTLGIYTVQGVFRLDRREGQEPRVDGSDEVIDRVSIDLEVHYRL